MCYAFLYPYNHLFSDERLRARGPSCFYIMKRVPTRHTDLACVIFYKIVSALSFKIMKENISSNDEKIMN